MSMRWASGGPRSRSRVRAPDAVAPVPDRAPAPQPGQVPQPGPAAPEGQDAGQGPRARLLWLARHAGPISAEWAPTVGRILLGVVFFWFGYHELVHPGDWTQYVPVVSESSSLAVILVLAHGWVLFVLAAALVAGIAPRAAAAVAAVLLLEIVISLAVTGLSDTALRDVGVLGLAVCLTGCQNQRLVLRG
jgi:uncharacterized membrane protein YphA (DoxX/SURF4 family)